MAKPVNVGRSEDWLQIDLLDGKKFSVSPSPVKRIPTTDEVLIAYTADHCPRAISARCPHRGLPLAEYARPGRRPGTIVCSAHQCVFDIRTGHSLAVDQGSESVPCLGSWALLPQADGSWVIEGFEEESR